MRRRDFLRLFCIRDMCKKLQRHVPETADRVAFAIIANRGITRLQYIFTFCAFIFRAAGENIFLFNIFVFLSALNVPA